MLSEHPRGWLGAQADGLRDKRRSLMQEIRQSVVRSRQDVETLKGNARGYLASVASNRRQVAEASHLATLGFVGQMRSDVHQLLAQARNDRLASARQGAQQRGEMLAGVRNNVQDLMAHANHDRLAAQQEGAGQRAELMAQVSRQVGAIANNVQGLLSAARMQRESTGAGLAAQAQEDRQQRDEFRTNLVAEVQDTLCAARRDLEHGAGQWRAHREQALADCRREVSQLLSAVCGRTLAPLGKQATLPPSRTKEPAHKQPVAQSMPEAPASQQPAAPAADPEDLTTISGIGKAMQRRLKEIGITRVSQLATCNPDELRERLGDLSRIAAVESWIEQARQR